MEHLQQYVQIEDKTGLHCQTCGKTTPQQLKILNIDYDNDQPVIRLIFQCTCGKIDGGIVDGKSVKVTINL